MLQSPNYIHFSCQWLTVMPDRPSQVLEREPFTQLWAAINDADPGGFDRFSYTPDTVEMVKPRESGSQGGQAFTSLKYAKDRLLFVEEWTNSPAEMFSERLVFMLSKWFQFFPETLVVAENCSIRALIQPLHMKDSRQFIGDRMLSLGPHMEKVFTGMPHKVGFTLGCQRPLGDTTISFETTVASWRDLQRVWIEVQGASLLPKPICATTAEKARQPFDACKDFLEREIVALLKKFDSTGGCGAEDKEEEKEP